jgi:hypothetical protein
MRKNHCVDTVGIKLEVIVLDSFNGIAALVHTAFH